MSLERPHINGRRRASGDTSTTTTDDIMSRSTADNPYSSWLEPSASANNGTNLEEWIGDNIQNPDPSTRPLRAGQMPAPFQLPMANGVSTPTGQSTNPSLSDTGWRWTDTGPCYQATDLKFVGSSFPEDVTASQRNASLSFAQSDQYQSGLSPQAYVWPQNSVAMDGPSGSAPASLQSGVTPHAPVNGIPEDSMSSHEQYEDTDPDVPISGTTQGFTSSPQHVAGTSQDVSMEYTPQSFTDGNEYPETTPSMTTVCYSPRVYAQSDYCLDETRQDVTMSVPPYRPQGASKTW